MFCGNCGAQLPEGGVFCANCGNKVGSSSNRYESTPPAAPTPIPPSGYAQPNRPNAASAKPPKKPNSTLIVLLVLGGLFVIGILVAVIIVVAILAGNLFNLAKQDTGYTYGTEDNYYYNDEYNDEDLSGDVYDPGTGYTYDPYEWDTDDYDGGYETNNQQLCPSCHGSGTCPICNGTGEYSMYGQDYDTCTGCGGDGVCSICGGSGYV